MDNTATEKLLRAIVKYEEVNGKFPPEIRVHPSQYHKIASEIRASLPPSDTLSDSAQLKVRGCLVVPDKMVEQDSYYLSDHLTINA